jgi:hypothetical protein
MEGHSIPFVIIGMLLGAWICWMLFHRKDE